MRVLQKFLWIMIAAAVALQLYFVRELIAALILLSVVFGAFAILVFALNGIHAVYGRGFARAESFVRGGEVFKSKPFRRLRSLTAR